MARYFSFLLGAFAWAGALWAGFTQKGTINSATSTRFVLRNNTVYTVVADTTIRSTSAASCALQVADGATSVIYIPTNVTLTVAGGNASGTTGAGAGILLPSGSTLIVTGSGRLVATGGNAANGSNGENGGNADGGDSHGDTMKNGAGGNGGNGGGGAAAAIGGNGGTGGAGGAGHPSCDHRKSGSDGYNHSGSDGSAGSWGGAGDSSGTLYVFGSLTVSGTAGTAGSGGAAGSQTGARYDYLPPWISTYWNASAGGGGTGGGGGGGGGTGGYHEDRTDGGTDSYNPVGRGGHGGGGGNYRGGNGGDGNDAWNKDPFKESYYPGFGGDSGGCGRWGESGTTFCSPYSTVSSANLSSTQPLTHSAITYNVVLNDIVTERGLDAALGMPYGNVTPPTREGYVFDGYYTQRDGKGVRTHDNRGKSDGVTLTTIGDNLTILYAHWLSEAEAYRQLCVNTTEDQVDWVLTDTKVSLREAIEYAVENPDLVDAAGRRRITFDPAVFTAGGVYDVSVGQRIAFTNSSDVTGAPVEIVGPTNAQVRICGAAGAAAPFVSVGLHSPNLAVRNLEFRGFGRTGDGSIADGIQGGVFSIVYQASVSAVNCRFERNAAQAGSVVSISGSGLAGGGLFSATNCSFVANASTGAGVFRLDGDTRCMLSLVGCTFYRNTTKDASAGSVIGGTGGSVEMRQCTLVDNIDGFGGRAAFVASGSLNVGGGEWHGIPSYGITGKTVLQNPDAPEERVVDGVRQAFFPIVKRGPADGKGARVPGWTHDIAGRPIPEPDARVNAVSAGSWCQDWEAASTVVTTAEDVVDDKDGWTSLREAIATASPTIAPLGHTVTFADELRNAAGDALVVSITNAIEITASSDTPVTVVGPGTGVPVVLDGGGVSAHFHVPHRTGLSLCNLTLRNGCEPEVGGHGASSVSCAGDSGPTLFYAPYLSVSNCLFTGNVARGVAGTSATVSISRGHARGYVVNTSFVGNTGGPDAITCLPFVECTLLGDESPICDRYESHYDSGSPVSAGVFLSCTVPAGLVSLNDAPAPVGCWTTALDDVSFEPRAEVLVGTVRHSVYRPKHKGYAAGMGVFVWHSEGWGTIAYSTRRNGSDGLKEVPGAAGPAPICHDIDVSGQTIPLDGSNGNHNSLGSAMAGIETASIVVDLPSRDDAEPNLNDGWTTLRDAVRNAGLHPELKSPDGVSRKVTFADSIYGDTAGAARITLTAPIAVPTGLSAASPLWIAGPTEPSRTLTIPQAFDGALLSLTNDSSHLRLTDLAFKGPKDEAGQFAPTETLTAAHLGKTLRGGTIYRVTSDLTLTATSATTNALVIGGSEATPTVIDIAEGKTLTVKGADAIDFYVPGGAGICLPAGRGLVVRGKGTLRATGGRGAVHGYAGNGGTVRRWNSGPFTYSFELGRGGQGGAGGAGAGAAIGTSGGAGGMYGEDELTTSQQLSLFPSEEVSSPASTPGEGQPGMQAGAPGLLMVSEEAKLVLAGGAAGPQVPTFDASNWQARIFEFDRYTVELISFYCQYAWLFADGGKGWHGAPGSAAPGYGPGGTGGAGGRSGFRSSFNAVSSAWGTDLDQTNSWTLVADVNTNRWMETAPTPLEQMPVVRTADELAEAWPWLGTAEAASTVSALDMHEGHVAVERCTFRGLTAKTGAAASVAGRMAAGWATFASCVFGGNSATERGGALYIASAAAVACTNCVFEKNAAPDGGAVDAYGTFLAEGATFRGNAATQRGGAAAFEQPGQGTTLVNCTLIDNQAGTAGGAVDLAGSGTAAFVNCTFRGNVAKESGGAVGVKNTSDYNVAFLNVLAAGNTGGGKEDNVAGTTGSGKPVFRVYGSKIGTSGALADGRSEKDRAYVGSTYSSVPKVFLYSNAKRKDERVVVDGIEQSYERSASVAESYGNPRTGATVVHNANWTELRVVTGGTSAEIRSAGGTTMQLATDISRRDNLTAADIQMGSFWMVQDKPSLVVTTFDDAVDEFDAKNSLREAVEWARVRPDLSPTNGAVVVTFTNRLGSGSVRLTQAQLEVYDFTNQNLAVMGPTDGSTIAIDGDGQFRAFRVWPGSGLQVENLVFTNCLGSTYGRAPQPGTDGGAILNEGFLAAVGCDFVHCSAGHAFENPVGYGGAICTEKGRIHEAVRPATNIWTVVADCTFRDCRAVRGGALYVHTGSRLDVAGASFTENRAGGTGILGPQGGAIFGEALSVLSLTDVTLSGNTVLTETGDVPNGIRYYNAWHMPVYFDFTYADGEWTSELNDLAAPVITGIVAQDEWVRVWPENLKPFCWYGLGYKEKLTDPTFAVLVWVQADANGRLLQPLSAHRESPGGFFRVVVTDKDPGVTAW